jgi:hypothetical protein
LDGERSKVLTAAHPTVDAWVRNPLALLATGRSPLLRFQRLTHFASPGLGRARATRARLCERRTPPSGRCRRS